MRRRPNAGCRGRTEGLQWWRRGLGLRVMLRKERNVALRRQPIRLVLRHRAQVPPAVREGAAGTEVAGAVEGVRVAHSGAEPEGGGRHHRPRGCSAGRHCGCGSHGVWLNVNHRRSCGRGARADRVVQLNGCGVWRIWRCVFQKLLLRNRFARRRRAAVPLRFPVAAMLARHRRGCTRSGGQQATRLVKGLGLGRGWWEHDAVGRDNDGESKTDGASEGGRVRGLRSGCVVTRARDDGDVQVRKKN